jgi:hypothetical protein
MPNSMFNWTGQSLGGPNNLKLKITNFGYLLTSLELGPNFVI